MFSQSLPVVARSGASEAVEQRPPETRASPPPLADLETQRRGGWVSVHLLASRVGRRRGCFGALHGVVEIREAPLRSVGEGGVKYIHQQQILLLVTVQMNKLYKKLSNFVCFHPVRHHQANFVSFLLASRVLLNWNSESHLDGKPVLWGGSFQWKACEPGLRQLTVCGLLFRRLALVAHADLDWLPQSAHMLFCKTMVSESVPLVNFGAKSKISRASTVGTYSCNYQLDSKAFNSNKLKK